MPLFNVAVKFDGRLEMKANVIGCRRRKVEYVAHLDPSDVNRYSRDGNGSFTLILVFNAHCGIMMSPSQPKRGETDQDLSRMNLLLGRSWLE